MGDTYPHIDNVFDSIAHNPNDPFFRLLVHCFKLVLLLPVEDKTNNLIFCPVMMQEESTMD